MKYLCLLLPLNVALLSASASYYDECKKEISEEQIKTLLKYMNPDVWDINKDVWDLNKYANPMDNYIMSKIDSVDLDKPISINDFFTK